MIRKSVQGIWRNLGPNLYETFGTKKGVSLGKKGHIAGVTKQKTERKRLGLAVLTGQFYVERRRGKDREITRSDA